MSTVAPPQRRLHSNGRADQHSASSVALATYTDARGERREIACLGGAGGTTLVVDRGCEALADARLLAHLAADEPAENAQAVCAMYLARQTKCRPLVADDFRAVAGEGAPLSNGLAGDARQVHEGESPQSDLIDARGSAYRLEPCADGRAIAQLRWRRYGGDSDAAEASTVSLREVIGALQSYEPALMLTRAAIQRHDRDPDVSVSLLRAEHAHAVVSPIVLNRGLREAVQRLLAADRLTLSEIAIRCGRVKRGLRGTVTGETSWLARRVGLAPEAGASEPTPWVHTDVLALIARRGLGVSPNEVEV
jgi:hypothetical protein